MLEDIIRKAGEWESESKNFRIDPFVDVYDVSSFELCAFPGSRAEFPFPSSSSS